MQQIIEKYMIPFATKLSQMRYLIVLRDAFMLAFPLTIFGSLAVVLMNLPFLPDNIKETLTGLLGKVPDATMNIVTLFVVFGIGYYLARSRKVEGVYAGAIAIASFLLITPMNKVLEDGSTIGGVLEITRLGAKGMFVGMFIAFISAEIYCYFTNKNWIIKMPDQVPPTVGKSFAAMIPATLAMIIILTFNLVFQWITQMNLHDWVYEVIQAPLTMLGATLPATLVAVFFIQILWFFGLHGQIIVNSVLDPIWNTLAVENLNAYTATGESIHIISKNFIETFTVSLGGTGMTLVVVLMMLFWMRSAHLKSLGRLAIAPGIFNVNEPVTFGAPIVLNPIILVPWVLGPMIATTVAYFAMSTGLVPLTTGVSVPWTVPIGISGMLATNSWQGGALQIVQFLIVGLTWLPFLKSYDRQLYTEETAGQETTQEQNIPTHA